MTPYLYKSWSRFLDLRSLLVVATLVLVIHPWRPDFWQLPSTALNELGKWLAPAARTPPEVALLTVDRPELALWGLSADTDHPTDHTLMKVLEILAGQTKTIGLVLPYPVDAFNLNSNQLEPLLSAASEDLRRQIEQQVATRKLLLSPQVVLGLSGGRMAGQTVLPAETGDLGDFPSLLHPWLWPVSEVDDRRSFPSSELNYFPVLSTRGAAQPLLHVTDEGVHSGFVLALLAQSSLLADDASGEQGAALRWLRSQGLTRGGKAYVPTSADGTVVPLVTGYSSLTPSFAHLSLAAAAARPVSSSVILIGSSSDPTLEHVAATLVAVAENLVLIEPYWFSPLNKLLLLGLLLFLVVVIPRISWVATVFLCCVLAAAMAAVQLWTQLAHGWWTPMADLLWCLAFGAAVIQVWFRGYSRRLESERRLHLMSIANAQRLTELGELEQARQTLITFAPANQTYKPYMTLAEAFASQGNYQQALKTVAQLQAPEGRRDELREKQEEWTRLAQVEDKPTAQEQLANTLVMELQGPVVLGRYEVQRELGRGAMGTVYLAYDPKIARKVAIKTLNFKHFDEPQLADIKARFYREAAAAGRLNHPHIVSVFDVGEEQDLAYIAMDYVEGQPLSKFVTEHNLLSPFEAYRAAAHVARALHYAHERNVIHRDIKPANIIYCAEPYQLKVTDFGIARLVDESRTSTGEILGSPLYIAPEQLQGKPITPAVDIFSLGVTFYQLLTGHLPFQGDSLASLTYDIIYGKPQSVRKLLPHLPASATRIVNRALQKDVNRRYESALEMAEAIEKAMRRDFTSEAKAAGYIAQ